MALNILKILTYLELTYSLILLNFPLCLRNVNIRQLILRTEMNIKYRERYEDVRFPVT
jgi:hypothetical protein